MIWLGCFVCAFVEAHSSRKISMREDAPVVCGTRTTHAEGARNNFTVRKLARYKLYRQVAARKRIMKILY